MPEIWFPKRGIAATATKATRRMIIPYSASPCPFSSSRGFCSLDGSNLGTHLLRRLKWPATRCLVVIATGIKPGRIGVRSGWGHVLAGNRVAGRCGGWRAGLAAMWRLTNRSQPDVSAGEHKPLWCSPADRSPKKLAACVQVAAGSVRQPPHDPHPCGPRPGLCRLAASRYPICWRPVSRWRTAWTQRR